jgi:dTDP-glucose pyrophosphorylase
MSKAVNLIMPMGGRGSRFANAETGKPTPKPLMRLLDKPFFYWAAESVARFTPIAQLVFVVLQEHVDSDHIDEKIRQYYPHAEIATLPDVLNGAVLTGMKGVEKITNELPVIFNDCDHCFYAPRFYKACKAGETAELDGALLTFKSADAKFSFADTDENGFVRRTVEKEAISADAICGAYCFKNKELFLYAAEQYLKECQYNEYFMSGVYNTLCAGGAKIRCFGVQEHIPFGVPEELEYAMQAFEGFEKWM